MAGQKGAVPAAPTTMRHLARTYRFGRICGLYASWDLLLLLDTLVESCFCVFVHVGVMCYGRSHSRHPLHISSAVKIHTANRLKRNVVVCQRKCI